MAFVALDSKRLVKLGTDIPSYTAQGVYAVLTLLIALTSCSKTSVPTSPVVVPVDATEVSVTPKEVTLKLVAGLIRNSGDVVPVSRTQFIFTQFNMLEIRKNLESRPGIPPKPLDPFPAIEAVSKCRSDCLIPTTKPNWKGCLKICGDAVPLEVVSSLLDKHQKAMTDWESIAWSGDTEEAAKVSTVPPVNTVTDLSGESTVVLPPGTWYVSGTTSINSGKSRITWLFVPFVIKDGVTKIELSNDNGDVLNH